MLIHFVFLWKSLSNWCQSLLKHWTKSDPPSSITGRMVQKPYPDKFIREHAEIPIAPSASGRMMPHPNWRLKSYGLVHPGSHFLNTNVACQHWSIIQTIERSRNLGVRSTTSHSLTQTPQISKTKSDRKDDLGHSCCQTKAGYPTTNQLRDIIRIFQPETVLRWHRELVRRKWTSPCQSKGGKPEGCKNSIFGIYRREFFHYQIALV